MASVVPIHAAAATTRARAAVYAARGTGRLQLYCPLPPPADCARTAPRSSPAPTATTPLPYSVTARVRSISCTPSCSPRSPSLQLRRGAATASASVTAAPGTLHCCRRTFYDKIREQRDGSEAGGPEDMFQDFAKSMQRQQVPAELHKSNKNAVDHAEQLNAVFCAVLAAGMAVGVWYLNPFRTDPYERPEGYGTTDPLLVYGSSDLAQGGGGGGGGGDGFRYGHQKP